MALLSSCLGVFVFCFCFFPCLDGSLTTNSSAFDWVPEILPCHYRSTLVSPPPVLCSDWGHVQLLRKFFESFALCLLVIRLLDPRLHMSTSLTTLAPSGGLTLHRPLLIFWISTLFWFSLLLHTSILLPRSSSRLCGTHSLFNLGSFPNIIQKYQYSLRYKYKYLFRMKK